MTDNIHKKNLTTTFLVIKIIMMPVAIIEIRWTSNVLLYYLSKNHEICLMVEREKKRIENRSKVLNVKYI